jgi:hypothetical protein
VCAHAPRLGDRHETLSEIRERSVAPDPLARLRELSELAFDPGRQLGDGGGRRSQWRTGREDHLDAVLRIDADLHPARSRDATHSIGDLLGHVGRIIATVSETSIVRLPAGVAEPFQVYVNGVLQQAGTDYQLRAGALHFPRRLARDRVSGWRWLVGAFGIGTYRQDDSVDVRYERGGRSYVAQQLAIEPGPDR